MEGAGVGADPGFGVYFPGESVGFLGSGPKTTTRINKFRDAVRFYKKVVFVDVKDAELKAKAAEVRRTWNEWLKADEGFPSAAFLSASADLVDAIIGPDVEDEPS